jgi:hypothetical protein
MVAQSEGKNAALSRRRLFWGRILTPLDARTVRGMRYLYRLAEKMIASIFLTFQRFLELQHLIRIVSHLHAGDRYEDSSFTFIVASVVFVFAVDPRSLPFFHLVKEFRRFCTHPPYTDTRAKDFTALCRLTRVPNRIID